MLSDVRTRRYQARSFKAPRNGCHPHDDRRGRTAVDRAGRKRKTKVATQDGMIAVLAGNYHNADDKVAKETLKFVKKFNPKRKAANQGVAYVQKIVDEMDCVWRPVPCRCIGCKRHQNNWLH